MKRSIAITALLGLVLLLGLAGCAVFKDIHTETQGPVEDVYAAVRIAKALQEEAKAIALSPTTPDKVVEGIAVSSASLTLSCEAAAGGAKAYEDAMAQVAALPEGSPEFLDAVNKANVAGLAARKFLLEVLNPAIDGFKVIIANAKKGK